MVRLKGTILYGFFFLNQLARKLITNVYFHTGKDDEGKGRPKKWVRLAYNIVQH